MFTLTTLVLVALAGTALGAIITAFALRSTSDQQNSRDLAQRLEKSKEELAGYQHEVSEHFIVTADLINKLSKDYREVHEYLANSALKLGNVELSRTFLESANNQLPDGESVALNEGSLEPPRDWAPKTPGKKGALSEDFGLDEDRDSLAVRTVPAA